MTEHAKKLANSIHDMFASAYAIDRSVSHDWLEKTIQDTLTKVAEEARREVMARASESVKVTTTP